jgi:methylaspartate mutase sigma subunit
MTHEFRPANALVILGVAASDAHAVANHLIAYSLRERGYEVVNLGTCTPVEEFAAAAEQHPHALALIIGSLNGHVHEDLHDLRAAQEAGRITCPVIVGGNLSVGSRKDPADIERLYALGVDHLLADASGLPALLDKIESERRTTHAMEHNAS